MLKSYKQKLNNHKTNNYLKHETFLINMEIEVNYKHLTAIISWVMIWNDSKPNVIIKGVNKGSIIMPLNDFLCYQQTLTKYKTPFGNIPESDIEKLKKKVKERWILEQL